MILLARMKLTMNGIVGVVLDEPLEDSSYLYNKGGMTLGRSQGAEAGYLRDTA